jgi:poly(hydroxyalkanoate) depolymerase family esterase
MKVRFPAHPALGLPGLAGLALALASCAGASPPPEPVGSGSLAIDSLAPVTSFGANPGNLLMFTYVPQGMPSNAPMVFAFHGCTEAATDMEAAGWDQLADTYKFYVVYPQQQSSNNTETCFDFFGSTSGGTADITRDMGEAASVKSMVDYMKATYSVDSTRVFATGFSAGAAYAVALLALYPDVFAGGASFEGIPFGCANSLATAYTCMYTASSNTAEQWATLVKSGYPGYTGKYPRISIWEGTTDTTVATANQGELVSQWTTVTGASTMPTSTSSGGSYTHTEYADSSGVVQVESYTITGMSHAVAIDPTHGCGTAGTYFVDEGICAVDAVAKFLGLEGPQNAPPPVADAGSGASGGSGTGSGTGPGGSGNGSGGMNSLGSGGGAVNADGGAAGSGEAPDAGAAAATMPGCSVGRATGGGGSGPFGAVVAIGLAVAAFVGRRRRGELGTRATSLLALVLALVALPSSARADEEATPIPDTAQAEGKGAKPAILGPQGAFFTGAAVSTTPALLFGYFPVDHLATTVGLGLTYNANGSPASPLTGIKGAANNKVGADFMVDLLYFIHDKAPFAMGPELNFIGSLSPNYPMTVVVVTPMWALRYAPWKAPIAIGTGLGMSLAFEKGAKPIASLATQGLDIVYAF